MSALIARHYPTQVRVGHGALVSYLAELGHRSCALLYDPAVTSPGLAAAAASLGEKARESEAAPDLESICQVAEWLRQASPAFFVAVGGGTTMDAAKMAHALADDPALAERIRRNAERAGALPLRAPAPGTRNLALAATTIGTGSEVSPSASVRIPLCHGHTRVLVSGRPLAPDVALLDPDLTGSLPAALFRCGTFEALARVAGAEVGSISAVPTAQAEARSLCAQLVALLDRVASMTAPESLDRLEAALLSAQSHLGWALQGRPPAPSPLWMICDELSSALGRTKLEVTGWLWPHWIAEVVTHGAPWGDRGRFEALSPALHGVDGLTSARAQLTGWGIPTEPIMISPHDPGALAQRVLDRWGAPLPMLREMTTSALTDFLRRAAAPVWS
jgi:NADP-dependent alcohol dehydrogenase